MIKKVCIFCASSKQIAQKYFKATAQLATLIAEKGIEVKYGGGKVGLMGKLSEIIMAKGGKITGVLPQFMKEMEWCNYKISQLIFVDDMHARKKELIRDVDAVIALPGGCGTLEELLEVITLKQLGQFTKPIIILNVDGFYEHLMNQLDKMISEKFMHDIHRGIWRIVNHPNEVIPAIESEPKWNKGIINFAQM